ncbi:1 3-beta-glucanosyltransferase gel4 [Coemansia sp. RSA 922]|nr:1 3-beta-glucanosyltransferase gel4 [Coemansia sp. S16]KAJ2104044.1 1 3-beta-glucanosyltransferase gel4 [Coemansia sp. RSA 922]
MKLSLLSAASVGVLCAAMSAAALDAITIKGSKFFNSKTGEQFFFKGIAYQPRTGFKGETMDPLADTVGCKRDIEVFKDLGINSIRVYEVDYTKNHDTCMKLLEDAGIYLVLDMPSPKYSINRKQPYWDHDMMSHWTAKVDAFSKYKNLLAWIAGNEVANDVETTPSAAFVKAAIRDMKAYLKKKGLSTPVGYADNDDMHIRMNLINYFNCGDKDSRADFYGVNIYRWCGDTADFKTSGYEDVTKNMTDYTIPSVLTEYGCNLVRPRTFPELKSLYGSDMGNTFSGGIMYEYSEEDNKYGIVKVNYGDSKVEKNDDYDNLKKALKDANPKTIKIGDYKPSGKDSVCPKPSDTWHVKSEVLPPTPSSARCKCMMDSLGCTFKSENLSADEGKAVGEAVGHICGQTSCSEISYDTVKGNYGNFVACDPTQRSAWAVNKNYLNQNKAKCEVKGADTKTVSSPKQEDQAVCLKEKDDVGNAGSPSSNTGDSNSSGGGSSKTDSSDKEESGSESGSSSKNSSSTMLAVQPLATLLTSAVALFYLF